MCVEKRSWLRKSKTFSLQNFLLLFQAKIFEFSCYCKFCLLSCWKDLKFFPLFFHRTVEYSVSVVFCKKTTSDSSLIWFSLFGLLEFLHLTPKFLPFFHMPVEYSPSAVFVAKQQLQMSCRLIANELTHRDCTWAFSWNIGNSVNIFNAHDQRKAFVNLCPILLQLIDVFVEFLLNNTTLPKVQTLSAIKVATFLSLNWNFSARDEK